MRILFRPGHADGADGRQHAADREFREAHEVADKHDDVATASLLENFIDEAEKRCWFLFEATRGEGEKAKE